MSFDLQFREETQGYFYGRMGFGFGCHPHVVGAMICSSALWL
jgi:hypothetical protein